MFPRIGDIAIRQLRIDRYWRTAYGGSQTGERDLSMHGRVGFADGGKDCKLLLNGAQLSRPGDHAAIAGLVLGDGRVDVETVDGLIVCGLDGFDATGAVRHQSRNAPLA